MINFFNKITKSERGQVAVVIILVLALALIFYAVSLNLGRISENKTLTQIASNQGASYLASGMASYGHSLLMQQLGGERKKCSSTGLLGAIIGAIIAVVIAVVSWGAATSVSVGLVLAVIGAVAAVANVIIQVAVIQPGITSMWNRIAAETLEIEDQFLEGAMRQALTSSATDPHQVADLYDTDVDRLFGVDALGQPVDEVSRFGIYYDTLWEGVIVNFIPEAELFQIALQDFVYRLPDNGLGACPAGVICNPPNPVTGDPGEECVGNVCVPAWALYDPLPGTYVPGPDLPPLTYSYTIPAVPGHPCAQNPQPSICNPCCYPETTEDPRGPTFGVLPIRPGCCDCHLKPMNIQIPDPADPTGPPITILNPDWCPNAADSCGTALTCQAMSPYGALEPSLNTYYSWVHDPFFEDTENFFFSFREELGKDDEHQLYWKDSTSPNWLQQFTPPPLGPGFYVNDTQGFYDPIYYPTVPPAVAENRKSIYKFLWKLNTWGIDLNDINIANLLNPVNDPFDQRCKWCDRRGSGTLCDPNLPIEMPQLALRFDPSLLSIQPTYCVDDSTDNVSMDITGTMEADPSVCVDAGNWNGTDPFWKRGADRFCSVGDVGGDTAWPYEGECAKYYDGNCRLDVLPPANVVNCPEDCDTSGNPLWALCNCGDPTAVPLSAADPSLFPEDVVDDLVYNITIFIEEANILMARTRSKLATSFESWFNDWQYWIDPGPLSAATGVPCYPWDSDFDPATPDACQSEPGQLFVWHRNIQGIMTALLNLRNQGFQGAACGDPWCVPPRGCPGVSAYEEVTFDANGNGTDGNIEDVIACLNFNIEGYNYACNGGVPSLSCLRNVGDRQGNDFRYLQCMLTCSAAMCDNLPRSLIGTGTFDPSAYVQANPLDEPDMALMLQCVHNCSNITCGAMPLAQTSTAAAYAYSGTLGNFDETRDCNATQLSSASAFWPMVQASLVQANPICDISAGGWLQMTGTSAAEAANQIDKFILRRNYLQGRIDELNQVIPAWQEANTRFNDFLTGPVAALIQARIDYDVAPPDGWPFQVVYGWQDNIPPEVRLGTVGGESYWHIVKVEARLPRRCDNACGVGGTSDPAWPKVKTYTKKSGFKRCYELINTDGLVKMRVTRYDESPDTTLPDPACVTACVGAGGDPADCDSECSPGVAFPNGVPIWRYRYFHPNPGRANVSGATLQQTCEPIMLVDQTGTVPADEFFGAFIMNKRIGAGPGLNPVCVTACGGPGPPVPCPACGGDCSVCGDTTPGNNWNCWMRSHFILANAGISSETCAQYYYKGGARPGLTHSFVDCPADGF